MPTTVLGHIRFFALWITVGVAAALAFTQGIRLFSASCGLCRWQSAVVVGALAGVLTGVMQWTDLRREAGRH